MNEREIRGKLCAILLMLAMAATGAAGQGSAGEKSAVAATAANGKELNLLPQPREVKETGGAAFAITEKTKIEVNRELGGENFTGASMLADEIERWTGWRLKISETKALPGGSNFIYIGEAASDRRLNDALKSQGLLMGPGFDQQGYEIAADNHRVLIGGASAQGAFYGVQTLRQLLRPANSAAEPGEKIANLICPAATIRDWPAMKWRGVHVDLSRGPILTQDFMEEQIRILSAYKINLYALYMEDVFELPGQPIVTPQRGALTPEEMGQLVDYAKKYYVTIVPELETFGHMHNVLRYDLYSRMAELPHGSVMTPLQPETYQFLAKMIADIAPSFPGPFFHIGADETFQLGEGQTKDLVAAKGLGQVYLDHIVKLDEMLKPYHKQVMFWADIAEHYPQLLPTLPKDLIAVVWKYDAKDAYDDDLAPFQKAGLPIFVSPGLTNWKRIYPDYNVAYRNISVLTRDGQKYGAIGMLNTEWNDYGEALAGMDWPGFVFGAACAWQAGESSVEIFENSYDWAFYRNSDHTFGKSLDNLAAANTLLEDANLDGAMDQYFWDDPFSQAGASEAEAAATVTSEMRTDAENAWASLMENRGKARLHGETLDDLIFAARRLDALGMKLEYTEEMRDLYWDAFMHMSKQEQVQRDLQRISSTNGRLEDLREIVTELRDAYEKRWRAENENFWLGSVLVKYDTLAGEIQKKIWEIDDLESAFKHGGTLPEPQSLGFYGQPTSGTPISQK